MSYEGYDDHCPIRQLIEIISDKWVAAMIYTLALGPERPGQLQRMLPGLSKKMLTQTLRNLEVYGLVDRKVFNVVPPHVEYSLTKDGIVFSELLGIMCEWSNERRSLIEAMSERRQAARKQKNENPVLGVTVS